MEKKTYSSIEEYFRSCDEKDRSTMEELRSFIKKEVPEVTEKISWNMPTFHYKKNIAHFFAHKNHIGFYPGAEAIVFFQEEMEDRKLSYSKGAVQFPKSEPIPFDLVKKMIHFNLEQFVEKE